VQQHALPAADAAACLLPLAVSNVKLKDKSDEVSAIRIQMLFGRDLQSVSESSQPSGASH
jgi:hypothetical protein